MPEDNVLWTLKLLGYLALTFVLGAPVMGFWVLAVIALSIIGGIVVGSRRRRQHHD